MRVWDLPDLYREMLFSKKKKKGYKDVQMIVIWIVI